MFISVIIVCHLFHKRLTFLQKFRYEIECTVALHKQTLPNSVIWLNKHINCDQKNLKIKELKSAYTKLPVQKPLISEVRWFTLLKSIGQNHVC